MTENLTVKELYNILETLIKDDCGEYKIIISFDSGHGGTTIKNKPPKINKNEVKEYCSVKFEGY